MKKILMISIALLIFIVGVSCASAINLDVEKGTKALGSDELIKVTGDASDRELLRHYFGPRYQVTKNLKTINQLYNQLVYTIKVKNTVVNIK